MSEKDFVVQSKLVDLFRKLFCDPTGIILCSGEDVDKEKPENYYMNGKNHGRSGSCYPRAKRRYSLPRRDTKVVDSSCYSKEKRRSRKCSRENKSSSGWVVYLVVLVISILCYLNSFHGDFVHDDLSAIKTNGDVTGHGGIWEIFFNDFWGKPMADRTSHKSYRPFTILTFR